MLGRADKMDLSCYVSSDALDKSIDYKIRNEFLDDVVEIAKANDMDGYSAGFDSLVNYALRILDKYHLNYYVHLGQKQKEIVAKFRRIATVLERNKR